MLDAMLRALRPRAPKFRALRPRAPRFRALRPRATRFQAPRPRATRFRTPRFQASFLELGIRFTAGRAVARATGEAGFATVVSLALMAVLAVCGAAALAVGEIAITRQQAGSAADLAALSVASRIAVGDDDSAACEAAGIVASAALAQIVSCAADGSDALVEASRRPPNWLVAVVSLAGSPDGTVHARARAGPPDLGG